ncbi:MAG: hypothetical protein AB8G16_04365 [Gammaproteobacteria bacterium]
MKKISSVLVTMAIIGASSTALAFSEELILDTRTQVAKADLVFLGTVKRVDYAPSEGRTAIPHTFVTYEVERVLHGEAKEKFVTLRFLGGWDGKEDFLHYDGAPLFDVGERDILMVANNNSAACPLVNCGDGRIRIVDDKAFSNTGRALELDSNGQLNKVEYYAVEEAVTHNVAQIDLTITEHPDSGETREEFVSPGRGAHLNESALVAHLSADAHALGPATPAVFRNADIEQSFQFDLAPTAPPKSFDEPKLLPSVFDRDSAHDAAEAAALARNGGNPVLSEQDHKVVSEATFQTAVEK